jgi:hypothetical protein
LPEKSYTYSQQLVLEVVKSQYGVPTLGVLIFPLLGITAAVIITPLLALLFPDLSAGAKAAVEALSPLQMFLIFSNPALTGLYITDKTLNLEITKKLQELNLGNRLVSFLT